MSARFVILHHVLPGGEHWDLMLEVAGVLLTWQLPVQPDGAISLPVSAHRIGDHRLGYLDYEGPVSRDRGEVRRVDRGALRIVDKAGDRVVFEAEGERLRDRFELRCVRGDEWILGAVERSTG